MKTLYETTVRAIGGRSGRIISDDGKLDMALSPPIALGGKGDETNPEQLFAAGYAACFGNAVIHVARRFDAAINDEDVGVTATVGIGPNDTGGFQLSATLEVAIAGVEQAVAEEVVQAAHAACPYSNAVRGNIDVKIGIAVS